jgi:tRNA (guanine26-N2/guanine27-N2)-dimethyltransferase
MSTTDGEFAKSKSNVKKVTEGSCHMCFAADEETTVFYNPVQVQNRDLSVLMISLYAERRRAVEMERLQAKAAKQKAKNAPTAAEDEPVGVSTTESSAGEKSQVNTATTTTDNSSMEVVGLHVLDALAASGLRSMRYWKECPDIQHVTINDLDPAAYERAVTNIDSNGLSNDLIAAAADTVVGRPRGIRIQTGDATQVMYSSRHSNRKRPHEPRNTKLSPQEEASQQWDIIDLDPYGSAAPFLDGAVQAVCHGGMLNVTCTDMAALGGSHPETCFGRYGSMPITRAGYLQELAVRILLYALATTAARYGRTIKPILSVGMDFYVRVFVEVYDDKAGVNSLSLQVGNVYQSTHCPSFYTTSSGQLGGKKGNVYQPSRLQTSVCTETGAALKVAGPMWMGAMHDRDVLTEALKRLETPPNDVAGTASGAYPNMKWIATRDRLRGLLTTCHEELPDAPLFYRLPDLSKCLHLSTPPIVEMKSALVNAGYRVSGYHKDPQAIKTDAPSTIVWDILRAWAKKRPPSKLAVKDSAADKILAVEPSIEVNFSTPSSVQAASNANAKVSRFPLNPQANWGPKPRASGNKRKAEDPSQE